MNPSRSALSVTNPRSLIWTALGFAVAPSGLFTPPGPWYALAPRFERSFCETRITPELYLSADRRSVAPVSSINWRVMTSIGIGVSLIAVLRRVPEIELVAR